MVLDLAELLIIIPAWNEAGSVGTVVRETRTALPGATVLVVDDGSTDETAALAEAAGARVLRLPYNLGVGGAMRAGYLYARRHAFRAAVQVDADGQHDPREVATLLAGLGDADLVIGARFAGKGDYDVRGPRRWAMRLLASSLSRTCHTTLTDATSGFRAAGPRAIALFARDYPVEYLGDTIESLVLAAHAGLRVDQVGVAMRPRQAGTPSQNPFRSTVYLARAVLILGLAGLRRRPAPPPRTAAPVGAPTGGADDRAVDSTNEAVRS